MWEHVVKWGHTQNPELSSDPTNFSKKDFSTLRNSLQQCTQFVNFYNLTSEEFSDKVLPYKNILPKELYKDLLKYYLNPINQTIKKSEPNIIKNVKDSEIDSKNIDSKIITSQHAELILKWINMKGSNSSNTFTSIFSKFIYNDIKVKDTSSTVNNSFKLLLRGTVAIIKVEDSNEILGGYNPVAWKSGSSFKYNEEDFNYNKESFIFSFKDNNNIENHILSRVNEGSLATYNTFSSGLNFGVSDLVLYNRRGRSHHNNYEKPIRGVTDWFSVEEYEVFQII
ncbi:uncharacterized protein OCT59_027424 [Rhizophagus irregularis]|uniref:TLDc domain-containing protein n=2 Tax=Rhizophagus irregularis TaxID=588596 RepID=A0A015JH40_RHIIW|nr:hypothetical protein RirG_236440 [Rhizophagus irregularis DAOM 197198w]UZO07126.1 hypothetical protein OCT59_027424 [Rhizophagus irregularis]